MFNADHKIPYIFIHIPKCAGNSVKPCLGIPKFPGDHSKIQDAKYLNRMEYFKFTFVRNPWARFLSAYTYLKSGGMGNRQDLRMSRIINSEYNSFKKFTLEAPFLEYKHFETMFSFVEVNGEDRMDFVGRMENYQEGFNTVCDKLEIPRQKLPHTNKSKHKHHIEYYDDETREIVAKKYAKDIEYFGYKFGE